MLGKLRANNEYRKAKYMRTHTEHWHTKAAELCYFAGVDLSPHNSGSLESVNKFQMHFGNQYQIIVYGRGTKTRQYERLYVGPTVQRKFFYVMKIISMMLLKR